jgi:hypothetical protein
MTNSQSASLSRCQAPIWDPRPNFAILFLIIFRKLRVCWCGAPSLTWGRICNLQCNATSSISSYIATDGLSTSSSWCRAPNWAHGQILISFFDNYFLSSQCRLPSPISPWTGWTSPKSKSEVKVTLVWGEMFNITIGMATWGACSIVEMSETRFPSNDLSTSSPTPAVGYPIAIYSWTSPCSINSDWS